MTRYSTGQLAVAIGLSALGIFAACVRLGDAFVKAVSPKC